MLNGQFSSSQLKSGEAVGHLVCLVYVKGCAKLISSPLAVILFNYLRRVNNSDLKERKKKSLTTKTTATASVCVCVCVCVRVRVCVCVCVCELLV